jgi:transposase
VKIDPRMISARLVISALRSAERNFRRVGDGWEGRGEMEVRSHLAVVIAVLTGVKGCRKCSVVEGEVGPSPHCVIGLVTDFTGEANESYFLCTS